MTELTVQKAKNVTIVSHQPSRPFQAKTPSLKYVHSTPGISSNANQPFAYPSHRGNTFDSGEPRIARAIALSCTTGHDSARMKKNQPTSLSSRTSSGSRSDR